MRRRHARAAIPRECGSHDDCAPPRRARRASPTSCSVNLVAIAFLVIGAFENAVRRHDAESEDFATLESSRFTIPVSVIVAAYNEEVVIESTRRSFLELDYPEFEVIVVNDGSSDGTLERARRGVRALAVRGVRPPHLRDAARACHLSQPGSSESRRRRQGERRQGGLLERRAQRGALPLRLRRRRGHGLRSEGAAEGDAGGRERPGAHHRRDEPDHNGARAGARAGGTRRARGAWTAACSAPTSISTSFARSLNNRLAWSRVRVHALRARRLPDLAARRARGGRRLLDRVHVRGHRADVPHPRAFRREGRDYEIRCLPDSVGVTESPGDVGKLVSQRERWQRVINETVMPLPAHVVQPAVRVGRAWSARRSTC